MSRTKAARPGPAGSVPAAPPDRGPGRELRIGAVVQARMSSTRCPRKVLTPLAGKPLLGHLLDRLDTVPTLAAVVVATSGQADDDAIAAYCAARGTACHRGPLGDVARRLLDAAERFSLDAFVRVCGDSPVLDPGLVAAAVALFREHRPDFVTNCLPKRYPAGQSVEVVATAVLARAYAGFHQPGHFEHVTRIFYERAADFAIRTMEPQADYAGVCLAVDTADDLACLDRLLECARPDGLPGLDELAEAYRRLRPAGTGRPK